jgi:hypothetical protein
MPDTFDCQVRFFDEAEDSYWDVTIAIGEEIRPNDDDIFFYARDYPESVIRDMYSKSNSPEEWYIL